MLYPVKLLFQNEDEIKSLQDKQKLKEFIACRPTLREILREVLQLENK